MPGQLTGGGFTLDIYEMCKVIHFKYCFKCILDFPDHNDPDHDGITQPVIHFDRVPVEVTCPKRDLLLYIKRVYPEETVGFNRPFIITEQDQDG